MADLLMELRRAREATYEIGGKHVMYNNGDVTKLVGELYAITPELHTSGSSNRENDVLRQMATDLRSGRDLSDAQYGELQSLLRKYEAQLAALRRSPDLNGQDYASLPEEGAGRIVKPGASG